MNRERQLRINEDENFCDCIDECAERPGCLFVYTLICVCGCGTLISAVDDRGQPHSGHRTTNDIRRLQHGRQKNNRDRTLIDCVCGCGETREATDSRGRPRLYIKGHEYSAACTPDVIERRIATWHRNSNYPAAGIAAMNTPSANKKRRKKLKEMGYPGLAAAQKVSNTPDVMTRRLQTRKTNGNIDLPEVARLAAWAPAAREKRAATRKAMGYPGLAAAQEAMRDNPEARARQVAWQKAHGYPGITAAQSVIRRRYLTQLFGEDPDVVIAEDEPRWGTILTASDPDDPE